MQVYITALVQYSRAPHAAPLPFAFTFAFAVRVPAAAAIVQADIIARLAFDAHSHWRTVAMCYVTVTHVLLCPSPPTVHLINTVDSLVELACTAYEFEQFSYSYADSAAVRGSARFL